jgi:hypothetical protein
MDGGTMRYRRAQPHKPTAEELNAYVGRYESGELGSVIRIAAEGSGLTAHLEHMPPGQKLRLSPMDRDTFQFSRMILRFDRNEAGKVAAIDYSNPVVRNIRFTRLEDGE